MPDYPLMPRSPASYCSRTCAARTTLLHHRHFALRKSRVCDISQTDVRSLTLAPQFGIGDAQAGDLVREREPK